MSEQIASFEKDKSYKLKADNSVMDRKCQWLKKGVEVKVLKDNDDDTLLVQLPDGGYATCASFMLELPKPAAKEHADFADFSVRIVGNKEETAPISEGKEVTVDGHKFIERDVPLLFETGDYPDKEFNMTPEEGQKVYEHFVTNLKHIPAPISHKPTILDAHNKSRLSHIEYKVIERDGKKVGQFINGKVLLEPYLDSFLKKDKTFGLSARFANKEGELKQFVHAAFVPNPRVEKARVTAGSNFEKELAEFAIKEVPTMTGYAGGGKPDGKTQVTNADLPPIPPAEASTFDNLPKESPTGAELQEGEGGGQTIPDTDTDSDLEEMGDYDEPQGQELWDMIGELITKAMKDSPEGAAKIMQMLQGGKAAEGGEGTPPTTDPSMNPSPIPGKVPSAVTPPGKEIPPASFSKEKEELDKEREKLDKEKSQFEVDFAITEFRITPAEQETVMAQLVRAAKDDRTIGTADFATGDCRFIQTVKALRARPSSKLGGANFAGGTILKSTSTPGQKTAEENRKENDSYLARTPLGQQALALRNSTKNLNGNHN